MDTISATVHRLVYSNVKTEWEIEYFHELNCVCVCPIYPQLINFRNIDNFGNGKHTTRSMLIVK